jgi:hypothetical protein
MTADDAVAGIAATVTSQGLKCTAVRDDAGYPEGAKVSGDRMRYLHDRVLVRHGPHRDWNYTILPAPRPAPEPEPGPGPGHAGPDPALLEGLAVLAGAPRDLHARAALAWQADREHRLTLERGHERLRARKKNSTYSKLSPQAVLAAAACRIRLGMTWALLGQVLGVHPSSISVPASHAIPVLRQHGITPDPGAPRITTPAGLLELSTAAGITLTIPETGENQQPRTTTRPRRPTK